MGAGASVPEGATLKDVPQTIDKETCENLFLDQIVDFDEAKFDEMAVDGQIKREVLEEVSLGVAFPVKSRRLRHRPPSYASSHPRDLTP